MIARPPFLYLPLYLRATIKAPSKQQLPLSEKSDRSNPPVHDGHQVQPLVNDIALAPGIRVGLQRIHQRLINLKPFGYPIPLRFKPQSPPERRAPVPVEIERRQL